jgi:hypothetical protein
MPLWVAVFAEANRPQTSLTSSYILVPEVLPFNSGEPIMPKLNHFDTFVLCPLVVLGLQAGALAQNTLTSRPVAFSQASERRCRKRLR